MVGSCSEFKPRDGLVEQFMIAWRKGTMLFQFAGFRPRVIFLLCQTALACGHYSREQRLAGQRKATEVGGFPACYIAWTIRQPF